MTISGQIYFGFTTLLLPRIAHLFTTQTFCDNITFRTWSAYTLEITATLLFLNIYSFRELISKIVLVSVRVRQIARCSLLISFCRSLFDASAAPLKEITEHRSSLLSLTRKNSSQRRKTE